MARSRSFAVVFVSALAGIGIARAQTGDPWKEGGPSDVVEPWASSSSSVKPKTPPSISATTDVLEPWGSSAPPKSSGSAISVAGDVVEPWPTTGIPEARRPLGAVAAVVSVKFEPNEASAKRIRIDGAFSLWNGASYWPPQRGYMYFECPAGREADCRLQWKRIEAAVKSEHCVGFGWDAPPGSVRFPETPASDPDTYLLLNGTHRVAAGQSVCTATWKALPQPAASVSFDDAATEDVPPTPRATEKRSYGWQVLAVAYPSQLVLLIGVSTSEPFLEGVGAAGWFGGPAAVHWAHGHLARGFGSIALEVSVPIAAAGIGGLIGLALSPDGKDNNGLGIGLVIGALAVPLLDAYFAVDEVHVEKYDGKLRVRPTLLANRGLAGLGLIGEF